MQTLYGIMNTGTAFQLWVVRFSLIRQAIILVSMSLKHSTAHGQYHSAISIRIISQILFAQGQQRLDKETAPLSLSTLIL